MPTSRRRWFAARIVTPKTPTDVSTSASPALAKELGLGTRRLEAIFRRHVGLSPKASRHSRTR
jgi:hypothetical protein